MANSTESNRNETTTIGVMADLFANVTATFSDNSTTETTPILETNSSTPDPFLNLFGNLTDATINAGQDDSTQLINFLVSLLSAFSNNSDTQNPELLNTNLTEDQITARKCESGRFRYNDESLPDIVLLTIATSFIMTLIWLQRRTFTWRSFFGGRPAMLTPFPIVEPGRFRLVYVAFWAMVAYDGIQIIAQNAAVFIDTTCSSKWEKPIIVVINVLIFAVLYFPVLGGISTDTTLGYVAATAWIWALSVQRAIKIKNELEAITSETKMSYEAEESLQAFSYAIPVVSMLFLCIVLPLRLAQGLYLHLVGKRSSEYSLLHPPVAFLNTAEANYVRELFKKRPSPVELKGIKALVNKLMIYRNVPYFRFSPIMLATITVGGIFIYYIMFMDAYVLVMFDTDLMPALFLLVDDTQREILQLPFITKLIVKVSKNATIDPDELNARIDYFVAVGRSHVWCLFYSNLTALLIVGLLQVGLLLHLMISYRNDRLRAHRGEYEIINPPDSFSGRGVIGGAVRYMGFQAVMFAWGIVIQLILFTIIGIVIGCVFIIPLIYGYGGFIIEFLYALLPALAVTIGLAIIQQLAAAYAFTVIPCGRIIALKNPRAYSNFAYLSFFKNLFVGLANALLRLVMSVVVGAIVFSRLDMPTVTPRFKFLDAGFKTYETFIHMENAHLNPTLITFVNIVADRIREQAEEKRALKARIVRKWNKKLGRKQTQLNNGVVSADNVQVDMESSSEEDVIADGNTAKSEQDEATLYESPDDEFKQLVEKDRLAKCLRFKWHLLRTIQLNPILAVERRMKLKLDEFRVREKEQELGVM